MLDEFAPKIPEPKAPSLASGPGRPQPEAAATVEGITDDDFAKQLQAGMADLLGELENSPDMQAQFEKMMRELSGPAVPEETSKDTKGSHTKDKSAPAGTTSVDESFQATIEKTMERMRLSGDNATAAAASSDTDDFIAEMMKAMQGSGLDGEGSEEDFSKMILGMMEQLTNKEILYEPMKELDDKFPDWLEKNAAKTKEEDLKRYKEQQVYVKEIVARFEQKTYSDNNATDREYIVERMQKVCPLS
jgi:peroxin-19